MLLSVDCGGTKDSTEEEDTNDNTIMPAKEKLGGDLLTTLSMDNNHLSTILSMDSSLSAHDEMERELISLPPDINLPLSAEPSPPPSSWNDTCDMLDVGLGPQHYEVETNINGEKPFPFSADKGFVRSHRMQRKHYRGLSNPQCVHGIEVVRSPNLMGLDEEERKRWMELTGRDLNFAIPLDASAFGSWRNLPSTDFEIERPPVIRNNNSTTNGNNQQPKRLLNGSGLNLSTQISEHVNGEANGNGMDLLVGCNSKRRKNFFPHGNDDDNSDGVLTSILYLEEHPLTRDRQDLLRSTGCMPTLKRKDRTFKLTDPAPEHCPPGEFVREISLPTRIPEDAKIEAYGDESGTMLEIIVPKHREGPEEHEVRVCLRPTPWNERPYVDLSETLI
ncbi:hypothetical protein OSB04_026438 [Centaurea solstitialis]|uniref:Uncharacterized protein n=1 Tax=Centaurea solstitialis TaxID=347529 RepID=A0AA38VVM5_9ASTR|nr:hypothetical protein OSB04_026438 [Centaurea solstitialis]